MKIERERTGIEVRIRFINISGPALVGGEVRPGVLALMRT
jgi:hypothetical protein